MKVFDSFLFATVRLGISSLILHKLRSLLTALGIIFGVAAVICMLSISEGAAADEMRLIEMLGTNNIIVQSIQPEEVMETSEGQSRVLSYGIKRRDVKIIRETLGHHVEDVIPLREVAFEVANKDKKIQTKVVGTTEALFHNINLEIEHGGRPLVAHDVETRAQVCVIGSELAKMLFPLADPLGETLLAGGSGDATPYRVVGVIAPIKTAGAPARGTQERNFNREAFIPISTANALYGDLLTKRSSGRRERIDIELSSLYVVVDDIDHVLPVSETVHRVFDATHEEQDYDIRVPLASLQLAQKKKRDKQIVLGIIAAVSLLVGGIGIMNIMLASVTERTREIGVRRALGAKQRHIVMQFLVETIVLSTAGGLLGIVVGWLGAEVINWRANWETIIHPWTVFVSFGLSVIVGIFFGMYPAIRAAQLDPIVALRYE